MIFDLTPLHLVNPFPPRLAFASSPFFFRGPTVRPSSTYPSTYPSTPPSPYTRHQRLHFRRPRPYQPSFPRCAAAMVTSDPSTPWRVVVTRRVPPAAMDMLRAADPPLELDIWESDDPMPHEKLLEALAKGTDALYCVLSDSIGPDVLDAAGPRLKVVSTMSVGFNHIDVTECKRRSIVVGHTPNVLTETTADTAVGLVLAACRRFKEASASVINGTWGTWTPMGMCGVDIHSSTVGVVGLGRIGFAVAKRLKGFDCKILYSEIEPKPELADPLDAKLVTLEELLQQSDIVISLCPLLPSTTGMFNQSKFALMKKSAVFINPARGELVNQDDLVKALNEGEIFAAGLDVTVPEPLPVDSPLNKCPNCFILPHIGSASEATRTAMATLASRNLLAAYAGTPLPSEVKM